ALGVENVYRGRYHNQSGPGLSELVRARDAALDERMRHQLRAGVEALTAIPPPFDHAVLAPDGSDPRNSVKQAIDAFTPVLALVAEVSHVLSITINIAP